jgi:hypothetical protein
MRTPPSESGDRIWPQAPQHGRHLTLAIGGMSDEDDKIGKLLRLPATTNLMLLLVLGFVLFVVLLMALSRAD